MAPRGDGSSAGSTPRPLNPYGYCRYCGRPRPAGALFCGGDECETVAGRSTAVAAGRQQSGAHARAERVDVRRRLLRDTSLVLLVASIAGFMIVGIGRPGQSEAGAVLGATARPSLVSPTASAVPSGSPSPVAATPP